MSLSATMEGAKPSVVNMFAQVAGLTGFQTTNLWNFLFLSQNVLGGDGHYLTSKQRQDKKGYAGQIKAEQSKTAKQLQYDTTPSHSEEEMLAHKAVIAGLDNEISEAKNYYAKDDYPEWYTATDTPLLAALVQSVSLSFPSIETESTWANYNFISGYKPISGDFSMTFLENNLMSITNFFQDWFDAIYDPKLMAFKQGNKKLDGLLMFYAYPLSILEGSGKVGDILSDLPVPTGWFHLEGLLFKGLGGLEANYSSSDLMRVTATFSCDKLHVHRWAE